MTAQRKLPTMMTVADFLEWPGDGSGQRYELIDGELRAMAPAADSHNTIVMTFGALIWNHLQTTSSTCRVVSAPGIQPRVRADWNYRIPDLGVTCAPNQIGDVMTPEPLLLIEVLSPGNKTETYENVRAYATIPSVREIIVIHSTTIKAEILVRESNGDWPSNATEIYNGAVLTLSSIKASFPLVQLYASTHLAPSTPG
jgi:Uma2 family endonuclease